MSLYRIMKAQNQFEKALRDINIHGAKMDIPKIPKEILYDYAKFWKYADCVIHPRLRDANGYPIKVTKPTSYQLKFTEMNRGVMLKGNKSGVTTSESLDSFRTRLMPEYAGFDVLLVAQNQFMADQHLLDLKRSILQSPTCSRYLITKPDRRFQLPEQKSKMREMYVENPYEPTRPSRIIAIGFSESLAYSWKNVNRLQISDPAMMGRRDQTSFFSALYSRLSNTEGQIKIEGVAGQRIGYFWDLCRKLFKLEDSFEDEKDMLDPDRQMELELENEGMVNSFETLFVTADDVVKEGLISKEWLEYMKGLLSHDEFMRIYYGVFAKPQGTIFGDWSVGEHKPLGLD
jgi:hypothetical protein